MFPKKQVPKKHTHAIHAHGSQSLHHAEHPKHVHTPHTHHAYMYGKCFHAHIVAVKVI